MIHPARLALLLVLATFAIAFALQSPGGAQTAPETGRYAFADTTLLRDTLNLHFNGLFPLADSLGVTPDTLRALSIRYRMGLGRMVFLADSLRMPVDSVGVVMRREEYDPLSRANRATHLNTFLYTSSYSTARTSNEWTNGIDWNVVQGPLFVHNVTTTDLQNYVDSDVSNRISTTDGGWKVNAGTALGARAEFHRFSGSDQIENFNQVQLSAGNKQQWLPGLTNEIRLLGGYLDDVNGFQTKKGLSGSFNFKSRFEQGRWLVNDLSGYSSGNFARTSLPISPAFTPTRDASNFLDGTLGMYQNAPVSLNLNYGIHRSRTESLQIPLDSASTAQYVQYGGRVVQVRNNDDHLTATVRMRQDNDHYLNIAEQLGRTGRANADNVSAVNSGTNSGVDLHGFYVLWNTSIDGTFDNTFSRTQYPDAYTSVLTSARGGYSSKSSNRQVSTTLTRAFLNRITVKLNGQASLLASRYAPLGLVHTVPSDLDRYRQSYKIDGQYTYSQAFGTGASIEVARTVDVNTTVDERRTYRGEWRWNYRLLAGLTATQLNQLSADYGISDERATITHRTLTTLNAVVTPRISIELTHDIGRNTTGDYVVIDDIPYLSKSGDDKSYALRTHVSYQPSSLITLNVQTDYQAGRSLNLSGGANLNVPLGGGNTLSGDVSRNYSDNAYGGGTRTELDFWSGRLELRWQP